MWTRIIASTHKIASQSTETPGHVYCCRYEDALYVNRSHFIMLGMSWDWKETLGPNSAALSAGFR